MADANNQDLSEIASYVAGYTWFTVYLSSLNGPLRDLKFRFTRDHQPHPVILTSTSHQSFELGTWGDVIYRMEECEFACLSTKEDCAKHFKISVYCADPLPTGFQLQLTGVGAPQCKVTLKRQDQGIVFEDIIDGDEWRSWQV